VARVVDSCQFEGKAAVRIGTLSVCPSTTIAEPDSSRIRPISSSVGSASLRTSADPTSKKARLGEADGHPALLAAHLDPPGERGAGEHSLETLPQVGSPLRQPLELGQLHLTGATDGLPPPGVAPWIGCAEELGKTPRYSKATCTDSTKRPIFCASTWETANITTKKAKSSVMKSAYETSQRSWFSCSGGFFFLTGGSRLRRRRGRPPRNRPLASPTSASVGQEGGELLLDDLRVLPSWIASVRTSSSRAAPCRACA